MEKTEIILEHTTTQEQKIISFEPVKVGKPLPLREIGRLGAFCIMGYFWSRGEVLTILHPMGVAYLSLFFGEGVLFWCVLAVVATGSLPLMPLKAGAVIAAAVAVQFTLGRFVSREDVLKKAVLGGFIMALSGIFFAISQGGLTFYFAVAAIESVLVLGISLLTQKGILFLWEKRRIPIPSREETLGMVLLLGGTLAGIAGMELSFFQEWILPLLCAFFISFCAWRDSVGGGAAAGMMLGFVLYLCGGVELIFFTVLGLSGLLSGCVKDLGRFALATTVVLTPLVFLFYIDPGSMPFAWAGGWTLGAVLFLCIPKGALTVLSGEFWQIETAKDRYVRKKEMLEEKLLSFSDAFVALAKTFVAKDEEKEKKEIPILVDSIAEQVCQGCGMAHYCWEEELYRTYSMTFSALSHCEEKGRVTLEQIPEYFKKFCTRAEAFVETVNKVYENDRRDRVWFGRLSECRELVGQQMHAVGGILERLSTELDPSCIFLEQAGKLLKEECMKNGIRLKDVRVAEEKSGCGRQVKVSLRGCGGQRKCRHKLLPLVRKTMDKPMELMDKNTCHCGEDGICSLSFREIPSFSLATATAFLSANENQPSGDTTAAMETEGGLALMALSDGMGNGADAAEESRTAIELLEQFTEAGFERELSVKMINSALLLRRGEESYATLDICAVDLFSGKAEFIKLGAVSSYISRDGRILSVSAHTLPAGILKQIQVLKNDMLLKDGDMVFMLTDGVTDALGGEMAAHQWLKEKLAACPMANPQDAADYILQEARKERGEQERDDMTVLAGRFWRRRKGA